MRNITTYEHVRNVEFHVGVDGILLGIAICGPGRDQRRYYAVRPLGEENRLTPEKLDEALDIMKALNPEGYEELIQDIIPNTIEVLKKHLI